MSYRVEERGNARELRLDGYTCHHCMTTIDRADEVVRAVWAEKYPRIFHAECWDSQNEDDDAESE